MIAYLLICCLSPKAQSRKLETDNIENAFWRAQLELQQDTMRPAFHLTPPAGCMGDPNGGIYHDGWYHIFYGLQPFSARPGGWYWAHARSRDLLNWEHLPPRLTPAFELGLNAVGSGSTLITKGGQKLAFYSQSKDGPMQFWRAEFTDDDLVAWKHEGKNPILTLDHPGLPPYDGFWRDPFVFQAGGRTLMIACADLFEENYVPVPIFEAQNDELTAWEFRGHLFTVSKSSYRNLEVPEFRPIGDKWILMASTDAPVDRTVYFIGDFDTETLQFEPEEEGFLDYSGHYYAQESIMDDEGNLFLMSWMPGWDREWLPTYMNHPLKNDHPVWNGCFALPRKLTLENGQLIQQPIASLQQLRGKSFELKARELPVDGPITAYHLIEEFRGNQLEIQLKLDLQTASFCGLNVLSDNEGQGGLFIIWHGDVLNVDGVKVPIKEWETGEYIELQIFVDKKFVEVFVNGGKYCVSRQVREEHIKGDRITLTSLGGTARLVSFKGWKMKNH